MECGHGGKGGEGWGGDDDDDIQFMVNVVPVIRIDFPIFLAVSPEKQKQIGVRNNNSFHLTTKVHWL